MLKGIIFDMDGVLVDATEWHYEALNRALGIFGYTITREEHITTYNGLPTKVKLEMLTKEKGLPITLHKFINDLKQRYTSEVINQMCNPDMEKTSMIEKLRRQGYKIVVCSNAIRDSVRNMLERSGLIQFCDFFLSNQDVTNPKPSPEMYLTAINRLGLKPTECLIIEDSPLGIQAARASGAHILKVSGYKEVTYNNIKKIMDEINSRG